MVDLLNSVHFNLHNNKVGSVVVDLLFIVTPIVGVCNYSMFCCLLLYVRLLDGKERAGCFA